MKLAGRYLLVRPLGEGAMGQVWQARDLTLGRDVAVKVTLNAHSDTAGFERFKREAMIAAGLRHPGIMVVHDTGVHEGQPFIVMELLKGEHLGAILVRNPDGLPIDRVVDLAGQLAAALAAVHESAIVHRDLKPSNLFVEPGDRLKVCDFGIAKDAGLPRMTLSGHIIGTPEYIAPELWDGGIAQPSSDLYAMGCILYELLTGLPPFREERSLAALIDRHADERPTPPHAANAAVPEPLSDLVVALLAKQPADRPAGAAEVAVILGRVRRDLDGEAAATAVSATAVTADPEPYPPTVTVVPAGGADVEPARPASDRGRTVLPAGDGRPRIRVRDLPPDVQMRFWRLRAAIVIIVGLAFGILARNWEIGLTLGTLAGIADIIYRSRNGARYANGASQAGAQQRTRRQLAKMRRAGYLALDARPIPNSPEVIDHLVVGPTGVYAIDSEKWNPKLPIRTWNGKKLYHGPDSQKARLEHAVLEARQASEVLSAALGSPVSVRPVLAIYGPKIPWDIAQIWNVDVFSGPTLRKYLKRRAQMRHGVQRLTREQVRVIYDTAVRLLPPAGDGSPGEPG